MLSYENSPHAMGNTFANTAPGLNSKAGDHLSNGVSHKPDHQSQRQTEHRHIWLITGPAGCGKSTVAEYIAQSLKLPFLEGDNFHPPSNIEKMSQGIPLTDQDRWDWLISLRSAALKALTPGVPGVVLTCSALKEKYRDVIRTAHLKNNRVFVHIVFLSAPEAVLLSRVKARQGHYMGANMVHSQLASLEVPGADETDVPDVLTIDVSGTKAEVEAEVLRKIKETVAREMEQDA